MREPINTRVERGVVLLDANRPGWQRGINLSRLDISMHDRCALGQTYGWYANGLDRLQISHEQAIDHGFHLGWGTVRREHNWDLLTEEWRRQIEARLDVERTQWAEDYLATSRVRSWFR